MKLKEILKKVNKIQKVIYKWYYKEIKEMV